MYANYTIMEDTSKIQPRNGNSMKEKIGGEKMVKIVLDAGHGMNTQGKRTPVGEREWSFNNQVVVAAINRLNDYENVEILRVDDPSGVKDVPLSTRTNTANSFNGEIYVSCHHNAYTGKWGSWTGVETYTYDGNQANPNSVALAKIIHPLIVDAMGLRDRGLKKQNFHVLRETDMPAILIEGGFMDSLIDIKVLRDGAKLRAQGEAIADGIAIYFGLKLKKSLKDYLSIGDTGLAVKLLQENLNLAGYKLNIDSSFGPVTEKTVKTFQTAHKLTADGLYGPLTKSKLESIVKASKDIMYKVQLGAFREKKNAEQLAIELEQKGYKDVQIVEQ